MPRLVRLTRAILPLALLGCDTSTSELPANATEVRATVEAEDLTDLSLGNGHSRRSIKVVLSNAKGADIEREDVGVEVNGVRMRFRVGQGNYYDRHPYYLLDNDDSLSLAPGTEHRFVLIFPDSTRHEIGTLRTPAALSPGQFDFPSLAPTSGPISIGWRDLAEAVQLRVGRAEERREADGSVVTEGAGPYDPEALRRTIGPGFLRKRTDRWVLPRDYLVSTADRKLLWLLAEAVATSEGRVASGVSRSSTLRATRRIQMTMRFDSTDSSGADSVTPGGTRP